MADLAASGRANAAGLAGGVRREVVVEQEALGVFGAEGVELLRVADRAERHHAQHLGLAAGEQAGAVGAGQQAHL